MAKRRKQTKALAAVDQTAAAMRDFLGRFDMDLEATPENVEMVTQQVEVIGGMIDAMNSVGLVERGKRMIWLKARVGHGEWLPLLERLQVPARTAQRWMAEARYALEYGMRRLAHLPAPGGGAFDEADAADLDADDLADPKKPAPRPRGELERDLKRLAKRLTARDKREEALQREIEALEGRLERAEASRDEDETPEEYPLRRLLAKAVLTVGRVGVVYTEEASREDLAEEIRAGAIASLLSRLHQQTDIVTQRVYDAFRIAFPGKPWRGPEPPEPPEPPDEA